MTQTYWLDPTDQVAVGLRRYHSEGGIGFVCESGYHDALVYIARELAIYVHRDDGRSHLDSQSPVDHSDSRWPTECKHGCGYTFTDDDHWQDWQELIYRRTSDGAEYVLHQTAPAPELDIPSAPPGACWDAWWMPFNRDRYKGDDICLMVRLPNGHDWMVDSEASNCTRKGEDHECWVRHGNPRECHVTVDKNGNTCAAGAGSIQGGDWHGFLRDGVLA